MTKAKLSALNALRSNVMIADSKLNITYMNHSLVALMGDAEEELKKRDASVQREDADRQQHRYLS